MRKVFLGKPLHWLILAVLVALGWFSGRLRMHVTDFNPFILLLLLLTVVILVAILATSPKGTRVTRDPILDTESDKD